MIKVVPKDFLRVHHLSQAVHFEVEFTHLFYLLQQTPPEFVSNEAPRSPRSTAVRQNLRAMRSLLRFKEKRML